MGRRLLLLLIYMHMRANTRLQYVFTVSWPCSWATKGYTTIQLGCESLDEACKWHTLISESIHSIQVRRPLNVLLASRTRSNGHLMDASIYPHDMLMLPHAAHSTTRCIKERYAVRKNEKRTRSFSSSASRREKSGSDSRSEAGADIEAQAAGAASSPCQSRPRESHAVDAVAAPLCSSIHLCSSMHI